MLLNHACFFIPLRRGAQRAVLCQQICASGALLNSNPIRTTRQRRAHGDRRSSQLSRFEDALPTHTNAFRRRATTLCRDPGTQSAAQRAVLCQQICASGALLHNNPIRTTRQRRAHGDRRSSLSTRFEDALLTHTNAFSPSQSVPEARHFNISKKDRRISETRLSSYLYVFLYNTSSTGV